MPNLADIVKALRRAWLVPEQLSPEVATAIGLGFAEVIAQDSRRCEIRDLAQWLLGGRTGLPERAGGPGAVSEHDVLADDATFLRGLVDLTGCRPLTVVVDAGNGMGGHAVPAMLGAAAGLAQRHHRSRRSA